MRCRRIRNSVRCVFKRIERNHVGHNVVRGTWAVYIGTHLYKQANSRLTHLPPHPLRQAHLSRKHKEYNKNRRGSGLQ